MYVLTVSTKTKRERERERERKKNEARFDRKSWISTMWTWWLLKTTERCQTVKDSLSELSDPLAKGKEESCGVVVTKVIT